MSYTIYGYDWLAGTALTSHTPKTENRGKTMTPEELAAQFVKARAAIAVLDAHLHEVGTGVASFNWLSLLPLGLIALETLQPYVKNPQLAAAISAAIAFLTALQPTPAPAPTPAP